MVIVFQLIAVAADGWICSTWYINEINGLVVQVYCAVSQMSIRFNIQKLKCVQYMQTYKPTSKNGSYLHEMLRVQMAEKVGLVPCPHCRKSL